MTTLFRKWVAEIKPMISLGRNRFLLFSLQMKSCKCDHSIILLKSLSAVKDVLQEKLEGAQCSETVKSSVPSTWFEWKIWDFPVTRGQKLGARVHQALLEHSPGRTLLISLCYDCPVLLASNWIKNKYLLYPLAVFLAWYHHMIPFEWFFYNFFMAICVMKWNGLMVELSCF